MNFHPSRSQEDLAALRLTLEEATKRELLLEDVSKDPWYLWDGFGTGLGPGWECGKTGKG